MTTAADRWNPTDMPDALYSKFIINGVPQEFTPAGILNPVLEKASEARPVSGTIVDETFDPAPTLLELDPAGIDGYLDKVLAAGELRAPVPFVAPYTRGRIAAAIIDSAWRSGNFRLDDLPLTAKWSFNPDTVGDMAAFYASVEAAADYIDNLRLALRRFGCETGAFDVRFATPFSGAPLLVDDRFHPDPQSWIVYVPFDTSDYRLGGSVLARSLGIGGGIAPQVDDPDYLMDCFELVRELAEDGVLLSAGTVCSGGLMGALGRMGSEGVGAGIDISGVMRSSGEKDLVRVLFAEVPGAVLQVRDSDFDYIDAEFILQDVAYFPLGHPSAEAGIRLDNSSRPGVQAILESLIQNAEGED